MAKKTLALLAIMIGILSGQLIASASETEGTYADDFDTNADCIENSDSYVCPDDCWYYDKVSAGYYYCEGTNKYYDYEFDYDPGSFEFDFTDNEMCEDYFDSYYGMYYSCVDGCLYYDSYKYGFYTCEDDWTEIFYSYFDYPEGYFEFSYGDEPTCTYEYNEDDDLYYSYCEDGCWYYRDTNFYYCEESDDIYYYDGAFESDFAENPACIPYSATDGINTDYLCPDDCWYLEPNISDYFYCKQSYKYYEYGDTDADVTIYEDVESDHKNADAINYLSFNQVLEGYDDGTFKPENPVNRVESLKIIFAALDNVLNLSFVNEDDTSLGSIDFTDVEDGAWYMPYLKAAYENGIIEGYDDNTYKPAQTVNKVEILKIIIQAFDLEDELADDLSETLFPDVDNSAWYAKYVHLAYAKGAFVGMDLSENFEPGASMTRAEVAEFVYKFIQAVE